MFGSKRKYPKYERDAMARKLICAIKEKYPDISIGYQIGDIDTELSFFEEKVAIELRNSLEKKYKKLISCWKDFSEWNCGEYKLYIPTRFLYDEIFTINDFKLWID